MPATIETVAVSGLLPYVDDYGNEVLSRDYTTKANKAYVEELARSMSAKGVPDELITVARDPKVEGVYRIIAGNSRVQAMRLLGTESCEAVVLDSADMQAAVETTVRTNTKKKYEAAEEAAFVGQLTMFGDDQYVSEVSGIELATAKRVRKARQIVRHPESMSLLRLAAIAEFEGDEEAIHALSDCKESEWETVAKRERDRIRLSERRKAVESALENAGVRILPGRPEAAIYVCMVRDPDGVPEPGEDNGPECAVYGGYGTEYSCYRMPNDADAEAERRKAREREDFDTRRAEDADLARRGASRRREWLTRALWTWTPDRLQNTPKAARDSFGFAYKLGAGIELMEEAGIPVTYGPVDVAAAYLSLEHNEPSQWQAGIHSYNEHKLERTVKTGDARRFVALMDAMTKDGYKPCGAEMDEYEEASLTVAEAEKEKEKKDEA